MTKYYLNIMNLINQSVALVVHSVSTYQVTKNILWYSLPIRIVVIFHDRYRTHVRTYVESTKSFLERDLWTFLETYVMNANYGTGTVRYSTRRSWHLLLFSRDDFQKKVQKINFENTVRYITKTNVQDSFKILIQSTPRKNILIEIWISIIPLKVLQKMYIQRIFWNIIIIIISVL